MAPPKTLLASFGVPNGNFQPNCAAYLCYAITGPDESQEKNQPMSTFFPSKAKPY